MRETNATDLNDDCFGDLKPGLWLPVTLVAPHCAVHSSITAPPQTPALGGAVKEMLKAPVAINPVVTQPPALPPDLAAPRLRCPTEPSGAPRSKVSRRISAIAELRSQRKIQTSPLPPPLSRPGARAPKTLMPSTPRWLSSGPVEKPKGKMPAAKRLEPFSPQAICPHMRSLTFAGNIDFGELPRLRLQHRRGARSNAEEILANLQVNCLPLCRSVPRLSDDLGW